MENQKNETSVLEGKGLEAFFTEESPESNTEQNLENTQGGSIDDFFNKEEKVAQPTTQVVEEQEEIQEPVQTQQLSTFYYDNVIKDYLEDGDWEDYVVPIEVDGETVETPLSELKNVDQETFKEIKRAMKEEKEKEFNEKYISLEGLDETTKKMVELKKKGGDISSLIEAEVQHVHPLKGYDLDDERIQEGLVRQKLQHKGIEHDIIEQTIAKYKKDLVLDVKAKEVIDDINTNFDRFVESEAQRQEQELELQKQQQKEFRKTLSETIKDFDIKEDKIVKSLLDASTKYDTNGLSDVDKAFFEAKENPKLFTKVAFLLTNEELFDKHMGVKIKNNANLEVAKKVLSLKKRSTTKQTETQNNNNKKGLESFFEQKQQ